MELQNQSFTNKIADFVLSMHSKKINENYIKQVQIIILDFLCAAYVGSKSEIAKQIVDYFKKIDNVSKASVIGFNVKLSHLNAAFANGTIGHAFDFDDGHTRGSVHPGSVVIPTVFAVTEGKNFNNLDIVKAIIVGYEVTILVSSILHPSSRINGFHNTPVAGIFGSAASTSYLLNLNKRQIVGAFGNAISFASGTFTFLGSGSEIKRLHPGIAARDGIMAAELAERNVLGPSRVFEGENGVFQVFASGKINEYLLDYPLGESFEIMNLYFKPYPCCRHLHVIIDAVQILKEKEKLSIEDIESIYVGVNKVTSYHDHKKISSVLDAQMSIPYVVAVALLDNHVTVQSFNINRIDRFKIKQIMDKVEVFVDEECEKKYPKKRKTKIVIKQYNGKKHSISYEGVKGEPPCPMSFEDVKNKFRENCKHVLHIDKIEEIISKVEHLELNQLIEQLKLA